MESASEKWLLAAHERERGIEEARILEEGTRLLQYVHGKVQFPCLVPFGRHCFFRGFITNPSRVSQSIGTELIATRTTETVMLAMADAVDKIRESVADEPQPEQPIRGTGPSDTTHWNTSGELIIMEKNPL